MRIKSLSKSSIGKLPQIDNAKSSGTSSNFIARNSSAASSNMSHSINSSDTFHSGHARETEHSDSQKRKLVLAGQSKEIKYDYLQDPSLNTFLSQTPVQNLLERNGWLAENAPCSLCGAKNAGAIKVCQKCHRFYHIYCLPPLPMTNGDLRVLLLHTSKDVIDVKQQIFKTGHFRRVDDVNYNKYIVKPEMLKSYDAVLVFNGNNVWLEADKLGDMLAEYVDGGGGVVMMCLSTPEALGGKWRRLKYSPIFPGRDRTGFQLSLGQISNPFHPLLTGVQSFNGGNMSFHVSGAVNERASIICRWTNGQPLVAVLDNHHTVTPGRVVYLNFYPFSNNFRPKGDNAAPSGELDVAVADPDYWDTNTDGCILMSNALRFASKPSYPSDDGPLTCFMCTSNTAAAPPAPAVALSPGLSANRNDKLKAIYLNHTLLKKTPAAGQPHGRAYSVGSSSAGAKTSNGLVDEQLLKNSFKDKLFAEKQTAPVRKYLKPAAALLPVKSKAHSRSRSAPDGAANDSAVAATLGTKLPPLRTETATGATKKEFSLATETILSSEDLETGSSGNLFASDGSDKHGSDSLLQTLEQRPQNTVDDIKSAQRALMQGSSDADAADFALFKDKSAEWERRLDAISSNEVLDDTISAVHKAESSSFVPASSGVASNPRRASISSTGSAASFSVIKSKKRIPVLSSASSQSIVVGSNANFTEILTGVQPSNDAGTASNSSRVIAAVSGSSMTSEERQDAKLSRPGSSSNPVQFTAAHIGYIEAVILAIQDSDATALTNIACRVSPRSDWRIIGVGYETRTFTNLESAIASTFPNHFGILLRHLVTPVSDLETLAVFDALKSKDFDGIKEIIFSNTSENLVQLRQAYSKAYGVKLGPLISDMYTSETGLVLKLLLEGYVPSKPQTSESNDELSVNYTFEYLDRVMRLASEHENPLAVLKQHYKLAAAELLEEYINVFKDPLAYQIKLLHKYLELPHKSGRALAHIGDSIQHVPVIYQDLFKMSIIDQVNTRIPSNDYQSLLRALFTTANTSRKGKSV